MQTNTCHIKFRDLGLIPYEDAWELQEGLFQEVIERKNKPGPEISGDPQNFAGYLLFCEHPHVFTVGKSGNPANLLISPERLREQQATLVRTNRGGDITYHGPGQIVGYPILDLACFRLGIKEYIHALEEAVIRLLADFGIEAGRLAGATGVWLDPAESSKSRKICAIGVRASHFVTMHGFAFNVNTDLSYFHLINPCGFTDKAVTSLEKELGSLQDMTAVRHALRAKFCAVFGTFASLMVDYD